DVAHHQPAPLAPVRAELFDELHMAPVNAVEVPRVVVAVATQRANAAVRGGQLVPLFAGDLAGLAPDAHRRIGEKPQRLRHGQALSIFHKQGLAPWGPTVWVAARGRVPVA